MLKIQSAHIPSMPVEKSTRVQPKQTKQDQVALNELKADIDALKSVLQVLKEEYPSLTLESLNISANFVTKLRTKMCSLILSSLR